LHHPLAAHHSLPGIPVAALRQVVLQHRLRGFFHLQEERVLVVAALKQHDERAGAHTAHADHLASDVDDMEHLEQMPPIVVQCRPVLVELVRVECA